MSNKVKVISAIIVVAVLAGFYPFSTTDVPTWRLRVVNEHGVPYAGKDVTQAWKNYTLETEAGQNFDVRASDGNGYVEFPERKTRAGLLKRLVLTIFSGAMTLAHGSFGVQAYVHASGPQGYASVDYVRGQPPPSQLVLPTTETK